MKTIRTIITFAAALTATFTFAQKLTYPKAEKGKTVDKYFGTRVADPYRWLENDTSAQTLRWVEAENRVTSDYLSRIPFRQQLLQRLTELSNYEKVGAPKEHHGKWYFYCNNGLQNQSVMYVMDQLGGEPRVFLDPNQLSTDGTVALKGVFFSHNGRWAAYTISRSGSDWQEFYVIDLQTGRTTLSGPSSQVLPGRATDSTIPPMTVLPRAKSSRTSTQATRFTTIAWERPRAVTCCSTKIRRNPSVSIMFPSTKKRP